MRQYESNDKKELRISDYWRKKYARNLQETNTKLVTTIFMFLHTCPQTLASAIHWCTGKSTQVT